MRNRRKNNPKEFEIYYLGALCLANGITEKKINSLFGRTNVKLEYCADFKSPYSLILMKLLLSDQKSKYSVIYTLDDLNRIFDVRYDSLEEMRRTILDKAVAELNTSKSFPCTVEDVPIYYEDHTSACLLKWDCAEKAEKSILPDEVLL